MQRYFPASRFVVFTTLNEAMNRRELVTFISLRGASRTSMPCIIGGGGTKRNNISCHMETRRHLIAYYPCYFHVDLGLVVYYPWALVPGKQLARKLKFCHGQHFWDWGMQNEVCRDVLHLPLQDINYVEWSHQEEKTNAYGKILCFTPKRSPLGLCITLYPMFLCLARKWN